MKSNQTKLRFNVLLAIALFGISNHAYAQTIAGGIDYSTFICADGVPMASGNNTSGQLGNGTNTGSTNTPISVGGLSNVIAV